MSKQSLVRCVAATVALLTFGGVAAFSIHTVPDAAKAGDVELVRQLMRQGADVNDAQGDGMTALHWAADADNLPLAEVLLYAGANTEAGTRIGHYTPLHIASRKGNAEVVRALVDAGADHNAISTNTGVLPLHLAAASGSVSTVTALLQAGADPNAREESWDQTPLVFAAAENRVDVINVLLDAGADLSLTSRVIDVVEREEADKAAKKRLEEALAEFKRKEGGGPKWTPKPSQVKAAIQLGREVQRQWPLPEDKPDCDGVEDQQACLQQEEAPREERDTYGERVGHWGGLTPLLHAVRQGHTEAALALLERGADINQASTGDKTSPLLMAAINGYFDLALVLLDRGADPNLASEAGAGPLFAVLERQWAPWANWAHPTEHRKQQATHIEVLQALLEAGADPNVRLEKHLWYSEYAITVLVNAGLHYTGATPFWRAAHALDVEAMRLLKEHGADPGIPTVKIPERRRRSADDGEEEKDLSGLPSVEVGGPFVYPLHVAAGAGYGQSFAANAHRYAPANWLPAVRFLVEECGADVNLRDANGYSAVHHAAARGDNEMIQYLVEQGADVTFVSRKGQTTADMANGPIQRVPPFPETIELLVTLGAVNNNNCISC
jgi:uncharacterized protein